MKDRKYTQRCSGSSFNFKLMNFDFYVAISSLAVSFAHFLLSNRKTFYCGIYFCHFLHDVFFYNTRCLISKMTQTKNNLTNLGLHPGQLVHTITYWVYCYDSRDGDGGSLALP